MLISNALRRGDLEGHLGSREFSNENFTNKLYQDEFKRYLNIQVMIFKV